MKKGVFQFKHFCAAHANSSMKIGVDAVLIGAWAGRRAEKILDVGTGCGVIALIMAQRFPHSKILAIDIDSDSIGEASLNFHNSPWHANLEAILLEFPTSELTNYGPFDLIVSNPPYFISGIQSPTTSREIARHQGSLSIFTLLSHSYKLLTSEGVISLICPTEFREKAIETALTNGLYLSRECFIKNHENRPEKRIMMEFTKQKNNLETEHLTMFKSNQQDPTEAYRNLCGDLYIKF